MIKVKTTLIAKSTKPYKFKVWQKTQGRIKWFDFEYKLVDGRKNYASETSLTRAMQHIVASFAKNELL